MCDEQKINKGRRKFLSVATGAMGGVGVAAATVPFLASWAPSAEAQAAGAPVEVDVSKLKKGAMMVVEWRGKPVWIVRRGDEALASLDKSREQLRDPNSDVEQQPGYAKNDHRSIKPEYLVLVGICTHLGCSPSYRPKMGSVDSEWPGGFYCPCHGSKFDLSGRVYSGVPAPVNMEVPPHYFRQEHVILIGEDQQSRTA